MRAFAPTVTFGPFHSYTRIVVPRNLLSAALGLVLLTPLAGGCSSDSSPATAAPATITGACNEKLPDTCPAGPRPSYQNDVEPILSANCYGCHNGKTSSSQWPLDNYDDLVHWRTSLIRAMVECTMPTADAAETLSAEQRATVIHWALCGMPQN